MTHDTNAFEFIDPGLLVDGELEVVVAETTPADPARNWLPAYYFEMQVGGKKAGELNLRVGYTPFVERYGGNIGYAVEPEFRGHHYAERTCRLVLPIARHHGMETVWITCDPANSPSRRTCERLGAILVEIVPLPEDCDMYRDGDREVCRYRIDLPHNGEGR